MVAEGSKTRQGREQTRVAMVTDLNKVVEVVTQRAADVISYHHTGLTDVYTNQDIIHIDNLRHLLDLKTTAKLVERVGAPSVSATRFRTWLNAAKFIQQNILSSISEDELRIQYRTFISKIEELGDLSKKESTEILSLFMDPKLGHYKNIQSVLAILATAGVTMGLESVVESWVSVLEHHSNPRRSISQQRLEEEAMIALNGPEVVHCNAVVGEALRKYWRKQKLAGNRDGHFIR